MTWTPSTPHAKLRLLAAIILLAGLGSAGVIYLTVEDTPEDPLVEQIQNSKRVRRELEIYGGKLNLIGHDLSLWFDRQWHGKALWFPIAALTGFTSVVLFAVADHMQPVSRSAGARDERPNGPAG